MPNKPNANTPTEQPEISLVGRCFHVLEENRKVQSRGAVLGTVNDNHALVKYFGRMAGQASTLGVVAIEPMSFGATPNSYSPGSWQFHEDKKPMNWWYGDHKAAHP
jgi:hypothetical protein